MTTAVIFDLDGTLVDVREAKTLLDGDAPDFDAFSAATTTSPPVPDVVAAAVAAHDAGHVVLVVTGRSAVWRDPTLDWLARHEVPYDRLVMRWSGDFRPDVKVKTDMLEALRKDGYDLVEAWEDKPAIAELWESAGITTHLVPSAE